MSTLPAVDDPEGVKKYLDGPGNGLVAMHRVAVDLLVAGELDVGDSRCATFVRTLNESLPSAEIGKKLVDIPDDPTRDAFVAERQDVATVLAGCTADRPLSTAKTRIVDKARKHLPTSVGMVDLRLEQMQVPR